MQSDQPPIRPGDHAAPTSPTPTVFHTPQDKLIPPAQEGRASPLPTHSASPFPQTPSAPPTGGIMTLASRPRVNMMAANKPVSPQQNQSGGQVTPQNLLETLIINQKALSEGDKATFEAIKQQSGIMQQRYQAPDGTCKTRLVRRATPPSPLGQFAMSTSNQDVLDTVLHPKDRATLAKPFKSPGPAKSDVHATNAESEHEGKEDRMEQERDAAEQAERARQAKHQLDQDIAQGLEQLSKERDSERAREVAHEVRQLQLHQEQS